MGPPSEFCILVLESLIDPIAAPQPLDVAFPEFSPVATKMPKRPATKASRAGRARAVAASSSPTTVRSGYTTPLSAATPLSSAYPSTHASEAEWDPEDEVSKIPMGALTLQDPTSTLMRPAPKLAAKEKKKPFRFMDLPSELRLKVYGYHFTDAPGVIDLDPDNYKRIHQRLAILRTCRTIYHEASYSFYSTHTFRVFPTHPGRFFKTKKPLLARLNARQRGLITSLELRLGPGWSKPPRGWVVNPALGLADCVNVRKLTVFVECDPSDGIFNGFRRADGFYEAFSCNLLCDVLREMPFIDRIHFDAWTSVRKTGAMMRSLLYETVQQGKQICWGPERGWTDCDGEDFSLSGPNLLDKVGLKIAITTVA
ncbi:hypothetical protein B0T16DRAFT_386504 [Cercophora newfieldiana]|uniref:Uncharacterized protein n=1 Tax=Cercophora newfieldiana TaxID=92897 RepID=A0AA39YSY7_9PEZI|nr:hypothetical protein B0T16DRAFT_386504 [Cercophora newfieldiana]